MLIAICFYSSSSVKTAEVNWLPWSVLAGLPCRANASFTASRQNSAPSVIDSRQARTAG